MTKKWIVIITAIVTCFLTNTVRDIMYVRNNGEINSKLSRIVSIIDDYSLYEPDPKKMSDYAASGLVLAVDDNYTNYYPKEEYNSYKTNLSNSFLGIGIVLSIDLETEKLVVVSPIDGSNAAKAGILAGDFVVGVDGISYHGDEMEAAVSAIRGSDLEEKDGTKVVLTIERDGKVMDIEVERGIVENDSVSEKMLDGNIGYIRITAFNSQDAEDENAKDTYDEFIEGLTRLKDMGMTSLILDLRGNPGGSLDVVIKIADELLPYGIITYTEDKNGKRVDYTSSEGELGMPMAVLVNSSSASASEVLTGALKDYDKAEIVGEKTFGKGIVQTMFNLSDGSGLTVTTSKYYSPDGTCIHGIGIEPDVIVEMDSNKQISQLTYDEDIQLQKAVEIINKQ